MALQRPITVPVEPVLILDESEKAKVEEFVKKHSIKDSDFIVLFESAPQSGQLAMDTQQALHLAKQLTSKDSSTRFILSSATPIPEESHSIIDGSALTLRETAFLTHYCNLLLVVLVALHGQVHQPQRRKFHQFNCLIKVLIHLTHQRWTICGWGCPRIVGLS